MPNENKIIIIIPTTTKKEEELSSVLLDAYGRVNARVFHSQHSTIILQTTNTYNYTNAKRFLWNSQLYIQYIVECGLHIHNIWQNRHTKSMCVGCRQPDTGCAHFYVYFLCLHSSVTYTCVWVYGCLCVLFEFRVQCSYMRLCCRFVDITCCVLCERGGAVISRSTGKRWHSMSLYTFFSPSPIVQHRHASMCCLTTICLPQPAPATGVEWSGKESKMYSVCMCVYNYS